VAVSVFAVSKSSSPHFASPVSSSSMRQALGRQPIRTDGRGAAQALQLADLAVLVVGPEPPITAPELAFAAVVHAASERLFVVVNKADLP
jgi:hypothetical protein